jgi:glucose-1-phosphate thymidylyltransferase
MTTRAVVLARGLGTRMREADPGAALTPEQARAADAGLKPMIPVNGRPFLDYVLSALADIGVVEIALVVAPDHELIRAYYEGEAKPTRVRLSFVVQAEAIGTANAILAVERWTDGEPFLALNADNLYPQDALTELAALDEPGLPVFDRDDLIASSNIPADRIRAFAVVEITSSGYLKRIIEKPSGNPEGISTSRSISMNCWRLDRRIFDACREVPRSVRGEFELPEAVGLAVSRGVPFRALPAVGPVLDLSRRADTTDVATRLVGIVPEP